jgi:CheY-like chemotaxis protein
MSERDRSLPHIVVIEDNDGDIYLLNHALRENGIRYEMTRFQNGEEALVALCGTGREADAPVPDLILLDLNIPRSDGFEVIEKIRADERLSEVPMAVVTSSPCPGDKERCEALGATTYIQKATQLDAFVASIGTTVGRLLGERAQPERHRGAGGAG